MALPLSQALAERTLPRYAYDYYAGAAGDESGYHHNIAAVRSIRLLPRFLVPVRHISTSVTIPGLPISLQFPLIIAPMAMQAMAHPDGEVAVASAAAACQLPMILSTYSTKPIELIAKQGGPMLMQIYLYKNREYTLELVRRVEKAGFHALVLTVDAPHYGKRNRDIRNSFQLPSHLTLPNVPGNLSKDHATFLHAMNGMNEDNLDINALKWLIDNTRLPVWVKGILRADDARRAVDAGAKGVVVSNHGARQLESAVASIDALPAVVKEVGSQVPVLMDSGVRDAEDALKAIALGAKAVLIGRPILWALADGGEAGVRRFLSQLCDHFKLTMRLVGAQSVDEITADLVSHECSQVAKL